MRVIIFQSPGRPASQEISMVLEAVGISSELVRSEHGWAVVVRESDAAAADAEIHEYGQDKAAEPPEPGTGSPRLGGAFVGILFYVSILIAVAVLNQVSAYGVDWMAVGEMRAGGVMSGQLWRTITALTLHADLQHLLSNLAFGSVFGLLAGRILGGGFAWLAIIIGGGLGNFLNAALRDPAHLSIGASTAVFAALGVLVALALRPPAAQRAETAMKRWSPLIGGVLLLATLGLEGERTDVLAHVTGFIAGLLVGGLCSALPSRLLASENAQFAAGFAAMLLIAASWLAAIALA
ncbi:rhomboid family intramembrane serine protease [Allorhodopirellula solitaria]|uniref:Rhomboid family protein n=1 Tax=Allorhodopirellula solitaria TaxID=2527987 RepID=A0A5C5YI35_9BACT|nr:rhomboid family intramembrane serine protease [Allorhodopirellula solitaria]TWT74192.1 Rhomboid family protein [Allorhodopirellula solitaria]